MLLPRAVKIAFFDAHRYERRAFDEENEHFGHEVHYFEPRLTQDTAQLARGFSAVCSFVNDRVDAAALAILKEGGVALLALRSAGYNHVDLAEAARLQIPVVRVPEYSPHAVAEHTVMLALAVIRKVHRAWNRVREGNFSLDGLVGFDLYRKRVGIIGTGRIGKTTLNIFKGFGCEIIAYDLFPDEAAAHEMGFRYADLDELYRSSDLISLHVPLTPQTSHLIGASSIARMKRGVVIVNTGRGQLIDTRALIEGLKTGQVGAAGLDVYEEEEGLFFRDLSDLVLQDDVLARLLMFPNVLVTAHQGFLTREALSNIAFTTLSSVSAFENGEPLQNEVRAEDVLRG